VTFVVYVAAKETFIASRPNAYPSTPGLYSIIDLLGERNLIYLGPLVFVGMAIWIEWRRVNLLTLGVSAAILVAIFAWIPYVFAAPSAPHSPTVVSISHLSSELGLSHAAVRFGLLAATVAAAGAVAAGARARSGLVRGAVFALAGMVTVGWSITGEVNASNASHAIGRGLVASQPRPLDWIERATAGRPTTYVGQPVLRAPEILSLAFWNPSVTRMLTVHGTPVFGLIDIARIRSMDGLLATRDSTPFVVADREVQIDGRWIARAKRWDLYRVHGPPRLRSFEAGVWQDGWMESESSYDRFSPAHARGLIRIFLSQQSWRGPDVGTRARIVVGPLVYADGALVLSRITAIREVRVRAGRNGVSIALTTPPPPFGVRVRASPTFVPARLVRTSPDRRHLGAQIAYRFEESHK
jgi:hypothetical protein